MDKLKTMLEYPLDEPKEIREFILDEGKSGAVGTMNSYVGWLEIIDGEVMLRIFAYRKYAKKGILFTEVIRRMPGEDKLIYKNMHFVVMGGWQVVYEMRNVISHSYGYSYKVFSMEEYDEWYSDNSKWFRRWYKILNIGELKKTRYKYCSYTKGDLIDYLNEYDKEPRVEFFGKIGVYPKASLVKKCHDKGFCRYLKENATQVEHFGSKATVYGYNHGITPERAYTVLELRRDFKHKLPEVKDTPISLDALTDYISKSVPAVQISTYNDYLKSVKYLGLDLTDPKIAFPKDFDEAHDLRAYQYESAVCKNDNDKRSTMYTNFRHNCEIHKNCEYRYGEYIIVLPSLVADLKKEGNALHHCVGQMGYDCKVAEGKSIIAFMRKSAKPDVPLYTIEYDMETHKVKQSHGFKNCALDSEAQKILTKWEKRTTRILKTQI